MSAIVYISVPQTLKFESGIFEFKNRPNGLQYVILGIVKPFHAKNWPYLAKYGHLAIFGLKPYGQKVWSIWVSLERSHKN